MGGILCVELQIFELSESCFNLVNRFNFMGWNAVAEYNFRKWRDTIQLEWLTRYAMACYAAGVRPDYLNGFYRYLKTLEVKTNESKRS